MEQMTYEQVLASIDRERAAAAIAGMLIFLGGLDQWGGEEFSAVQEMLDGARPDTLPEFGDQDAAALKFWGTLSAELGNVTDYDPDAHQYVATINVPGYMPMDDDPPVFDDPAEAWAYLVEERKRGELDDETTEEYTSTVEALMAMAEGDGGVATIVGPTPGYTGDHDLGLAYSVSIYEED